MASRLGYATVRVEAELVRQYYYLWEWLVLVRSLSFLIHRIAKSVYSAFRCPFLGTAWMAARAHHRSPISTFISRIRQSGSSTLLPPSPISHPRTLSHPKTRMISTFNSSSGSRVGLAIQSQLEKMGLCRLSVSLARNNNQRRNGRIDWLLL